MKRKKIIWTIVLVLLVLIAGAGYYAWKEYNRTNKDLKHEKAAFSLAATDLITEFAANEKTSNTKYLGKIVEVSGAIKQYVIRALQHG
jgi:flagellar basal body-associated protein FliL